MEHFTTGSPFWANSHCTKRTCNGGLWYDGGMSQLCWAGSWIPHNFAWCRENSVFCIVLVFDLDQVKGKLGFVLAFWKISAADFLETWCCQITFVESVLASFPGKAFLNVFSHGLRQKVEENGNFECKGTKNWEVNCSSNSELTTMNSTSSSSGPLFVTLTVSHSWHRNNPPALCWWEQNRIFVGALWGSTLDEAMF